MDFIEEFKDNEFNKKKVNLFLKNMPAKINNLSNKRPMGRISQLRNQFKLMNTFEQVMIIYIIKLAQ